ncbi:MAG: hypothetical protein K2K08_01305 [Paramuribaculum sp.]|nr:hypothetical protein [Paramuribaculum sp.]
MKNNNLEDKKLGALLKNELPNAPYNPWFTRTVLNRLPERKRRVAANTEMWVCVIAAVVTLIFGVKFSAESYASDSITVMNLMIFCTYCSLFGALVANVAVPLMKRRVIKKI